MLYSRCWKTDLSLYQTSYIRLATISIYLLNGLDRTRFADKRITLLRRLRQHRAHASTVGGLIHIPRSAVGYLFGIGNCCRDIVISGHKVPGIIARLVPDGRGEVQRQPLQLSTPILGNSCETFFDTRIGRKLTTYVVCVVVRQTHAFARVFGGFSGINTLFVIGCTVGSEEHK